jgi:sugar/nucleoside kinase (ribokinase family)
MNEGTQSDILCAGSIVVDILVRPIDNLRFGTTALVESIEYRVGGNGANTSRALAILGVPVSLMGAVGSDAPAEMVLTALTSCGVDTTEVARVPSPTASSVVLINGQGDRQFLHRLGASGEAFAQPLAFTASTREKASHFHLASFFVAPNLRRNAARMLAESRRAGLPTAFDTNWDPQGEWLTAVEPCLPHIDTFFMNENESRMMTGGCDADAARLLLSKGVREVVIKLGPRGCVIYKKNEEIMCPAFTVDAVDTTGAGDCFVAGFLAARSRGYSLARAGLFANAVGALTVQCIGAVEGVVSQEDVLAWMLKHGGGMADAEQSLR